MKGLIIHQTTSEYSNIEDIKQFALIRADQKNHGVGSYSRIIGYDINELWNQTILSMSKPTIRIKKPFRMEFK